MKEVIFNNQNLSDEDIQIFENLAKNALDSLILEIKQNKNIINLNIREILRNS